MPKEQCVIVHVHMVPRNAEAFDGETFATDLSRFIQRHAADYDCLLTEQMVSVAENTDSSGVEIVGAGRLIEALSRFTELDMRRMVEGSWDDEAGRPN